MMNAKQKHDFANKFNITMQPIKKVRSLKFRMLIY